MRILGIDPGLNLCGYAVVDKTGNKEKLIEAGVIRTNSSETFELRLNQIDEDIKYLLKNFNPEILAVEQLYSHYAHPRTAILMAHARGVILQAATSADIPVESFAATKIKKSLTGNGRATKTQMQRSIQSLLRLNEMPEPPDVADAVAIALCCANTKR